MLACSHNHTHTHTQGPITYVLMLVLIKEPPAGHKFGHCAAINILSTVALWAIKKLTPPPAPPYPLRLG